jgi:hypothetical protein
MRRQRKKWRINMRLIVSSLGEGVRFVHDNRPEIEGNDVNRLLRKLHNKAAYTRTANQGLIACIA